MGDLAEQRGRGPSSHQQAFPGTGLVSGEPQEDSQATRVGLVPSGLVAPERKSPDLGSYSVVCGYRQVWSKAQDSRKFPHYICSGRRARFNKHPECWAKSVSLKE